MPLYANKELSIVKKNLHGEWDGKVGPISMPGIHKIGVHDHGKGSPFKCWLFLKYHQLNTSFAISL